MAIMAVYTEVASEKLHAFLEGYSVGDLVSAKGIAEGVENSNYVLETVKDRFILTLYEKRVNEKDLPFFIDLMGHYAKHGLPVPRPISDRKGKILQRLEGRPACLIEFLPGISVLQPDPALCYEAGIALASLHLAGADFSQKRDNDLSLTAWKQMACDISEDIKTIDPMLPAQIDESLEQLDANWPKKEYSNLPCGITHGDLFPDNVLTQDGKVVGLIDFYFSAYDFFAYDLAVMHSAWCFDPSGHHFHADRAAMLVRGYETIRSLTPEEKDLFAIFSQGAALRFLLTRCVDWLATPASALVKRKHPMDYARRLLHYKQTPSTILLGLPQ